jgi:HlyD family secretion protein
MTQGDLGVAVEAKGRVPYPPARTGGKTNLRKDKPLFHRFKGIFPQSQKRRKRQLLFSLLLLLIGAATVGYLFYGGPPPLPRYTTVSIDRGSITTTVNATGTVNAVVNVQVGTQVSGIIQKLFVDFNATVKKGDVIAQLDPAILETKVEQARANVSNATALAQVAQTTVVNNQAAVETARANVESAKASIEDAQITLDDARRTLARKRGLSARGLIPQSELDTAHVTYDSAVAKLKVAVTKYDATMGQLKSATAQAHTAEAQLRAALTQVEQTKAALQAAELDLQHTTIRSPVNGIVIVRNVDVGQTVAASLQAPTLFIIAQDLTRMQVDSNVSEADIGRIAVGQTATFTVDAYPNTTFSGQVVQVRNAPITVQNVVTYNAVVQVANPALQLKPGMTANVAFIIAERNDVLKVPNAALRFQPDGIGQEPSRPDSKEAPSSGGGGRMQDLLQRLTHAVGLTADQQTRVGEIVQKARPRFMALRAEESEERRRTLRREIQAQIQTQVRDLLTPEQRQKFDAFVAAQTEQAPAERPGRVWVAGPTGVPEPRAVTLGIANDTHTEVVSGELTAGQQVLTGIVAGAKRTRVAPPGFGGQRAL